MKKQPTNIDLVNEARVKPRNSNRAVAWAIGGAVVIGGLIALVTGEGLHKLDRTLTGEVNQASSTKYELKPADTNNYQVLGPQTDGTNILPRYNLSTNEVGTQ